MFLKKQLNKEAMRLQWGQIKTLFILCFLVLDLFLLHQFLDKRNQSQLDIISESTIEEQLEAEEISFENLPKQESKEAYISARRHQFNVGDEERLKNELNNQSIAIVRGDLILSRFKDPLIIKDDSTINEISKQIKENVLYGDKYEFWGWNEELNTLLFFQRHSDRHIFFNESGLLLVILKDNEETGNKEIVLYAQTLLDEIKLQGEKQELIKPIQAIEALYNQNQLYSGDNITNIELGYHTLVPLANGVQVFAPTWHITVDDKQKYFVNAMEGQIIASDEKSFVELAYSNIIEQIEAARWSGES